MDIYSSLEFNEHQAKLIYQFPVMQCSDCGVKLKYEERCEDCAGNKYRILPEVAELFTQEQLYELENKINGQSDRNT